MTKQHFIAFAKDIATQAAKAHCMDPGGLDAARAQCELICRIAPQFDTAFDPAHFRKACGL